MPFEIRKVATQAEKDRLIEEQRKVWNELAGYQHLISVDETNFLENFAAGIEVEKPAFIEPRELTKEERDELDLLSLFGGAYAPKEDGTGCAAYDAAWAEKERVEFEKFVAPARRSESFLQSLVLKALDDVLRKRGSVANEHDRSGVAIVPQLAKVAAEEDVTSSLSRFLSAYVAGNEKAMRAVARELASEAA